jgi:ABC-type antimicrobial peptide transport system permease subunit
LRGRSFTAADVELDRPVGIVSSAFVHRYFPGEDPIGKHICGNVEIVGVVADARLASVRTEGGPMFYFKAAKEPDRVSALQVRVAGDPSTAAAAIRAQIRAVNPRLLLDVTTMRRQIDVSIARERLVAALSGFFSVLGLLLAAVGIFGVASFSVAQRTSELGIRMALGAGRLAVIRESMRETLVVVAAGLAAGVVAAVVAVRVTSSLIANLLFGLSPADAVTIVAAVLVMAAVALIACVLPARRATRIDPLAAIRSE